MSFSSKLVAPFVSGIYAGDPGKIEPARRVSKAL